MKIFNLLNVLNLDKQQLIIIAGLAAVFVVLVIVIVAVSVSRKKRKSKSLTQLKDKETDNQIKQDTVQLKQDEVTQNVTEQQVEQQLEQHAEQQPATDGVAEVNLDEAATDETIADESAVDIETVDESATDDAVVEQTLLPDEVAFVDEADDETDDDDDEISQDELDELASADDENADDVEEEVTVQLADDGGGSGDIVFRRVIYNRSFLARITQASDEVKDRYSNLKNYLLSFNKVKSSISWKHESFRLGRSTFALFVMRGKKLCLRFATDPKRFDDTKYKVIDLSIRSPKSKQPCLYRITSDRKVKFAKEIIDMLTGELACEKLADSAYENYVMPYRNTDELIDADLIRVKIIEGVENAEVKVDDVEELKEIVRQTEALPKRDFKILEKVEVNEVDVMSDEQAKEIIEYKVVKRKKSKGSKGIINIDVLSKKFQAGSLINLDILRERRIIPNNVNCLKVLANGILDKPLIVEADDFSMQAVKMIALTGGRVIRTNNQ